MGLDVCGGQIGGLSGWHHIVLLMFIQISNCSQTKGFTTASNEQNGTESSNAVEITQNIFMRRGVFSTGALAITDTFPARRSINLWITIGSPLGLGILLMVLTAVTGYACARKRKRTKAFQNITPTRSQNVEINGKPIGGKSNPALEYSEMSSLPLSSGGKLSGVDHPVELSKEDAEVFNNGIVPLEKLLEINETGL